MRDSLAAQAGLLSELLTAAMRPELEASGITLGMFDLLSAARAAGGNATQADLARRLGITPPSLCESVRSAVNKKLVEQVPSDTDARVKRLRLTAEGEAAVLRVLAGVARAEAQMIRGLDAAQVRAAIETLRLANRNLARGIQSQMG